MDGNLANIYTLIYAFLTQKSLTKAATSLRKEVKDVVVLKEGVTPEGPSLEDIIKQWKEGHKKVLTSSSESDSDSSDSSSSESDSKSTSDDGSSQVKVEPKGKRKTHHKQPESSSDSSDSSDDANSSASESDVKSTESSSIASSKTKPMTAKFKKGIERDSSKTLSSASEKDKTSDSDSDSTSDSSESDSDTSSGSTAKPKLKSASITSKKTSKKMRKGSDSSSSSDSDSDSSSNSSSESDDEKPQAKAEPKVAKHAVVPPSPSSSSSSESDSDSSSGSESDSNSDTKTKSQKKISKEQGAQTHKKGGKAEERVTKKQKISKDGLAIATATADNSRERMDVNQASGSNSGANGRQDGVRFQRIKADVIASETMIDSRYEAKAGPVNDYGQRAHVDLIVTRGAGFRKEKNKKKKGSYKGGEITMQSHSFKFTY